MGGRRGGFLPWKMYQHEGKSTCARTEISQDANNTNQNVKSFL